MNFMKNLQNFRKKIFGSFEVKGSVDSCRLRGPERKVAKHLHGEANGANVGSGARESEQKSSIMSRMFAKLFKGSGKKEQEKSNK
ncbi:hypothetical protein Agabi119p4_8510 [Agaricus bisporus var. burnettii]|uniref:Uncharacterized protein n=1 Tax=Agaricus bisporus var. burnettii TaxID=192524 RepID=A0A8H7C836_AGABI|nr:hypothetical protein Agabi119p4_8510 [Agaricus bisporus var. burnettii]